LDSRADIAYSLLESSLVHPRGILIAADFPHELARSSLDVFGFGRRIDME
jgi:hypothetical protein